MAIPVSYTHLDVYKRQALKSLSDPVIANQKNEFAKILKKSASSQNLELLLHKKILRLINETFMQNLYHWKQLPWFHQTKDPVRKSIRKSPCSLQDAKAVLKFKVTFDEDNGLQLLQYVQIGKALYKPVSYTHLDVYKRQD